VSILGAVTADDQKSGKGAALPSRAYRALIEAAQLREVTGPKGTGTQIDITLGNLRTKEGETEFDYNGSRYRIGNRKVFGHHWVDHTNPEAAKVGNSFIRKLLISAGIVENKVGAEDPYTSTEEMAADIVGKEVIVLTKQKTRQDKKDEDGNPIVDAEVSSYLAP